MVFSVTTKYQVGKGLVLLVCISLNVSPGHCESRLYDIRLEVHRQGRHIGY